MNILNMTMVFGKHHPWDLFFFFNTRHFIIDNFSNYSRHSLLQIPFFVYYFCFLVCFNRSLHVQDASRCSCLVSIIRTVFNTDFVFYYLGLLCSICMELLHWQRGIFCYFSLLWTALKLKNQNKEQFLFVHVSVLFFYYFIN